MYLASTVTTHPTMQHRVVVSYPARLQEQVITDAEHRLIADLSDRKVTAIKFVRSQYGLGLYEAKAICDTIWRQK